MQIKNFKNDRELFEFIRNTDYKNTPSLEDIFSGYDFRLIDYALLKKMYLEEKDILIIDSRSPKEFGITSLFDAVNFPVLDDYERHNVGLIYKKYSQKAALYLALEYANNKYDNLKDFIDENTAGEKQIIVHCWRGGGRSRFLSKMIIDTGYTPLILEGGIKSYRKEVNRFFSEPDFPFDLIEISGLTGTGKSELLDKIKNEIPVIDLEFAAKHFSSLFGYIPYKIRNYCPVSNQGSFENNVYNNIVKNEKYFKKIKFFLIESESKKIGDFFIPDNLYNEMVKANSIKVHSDLEFRIKRIKKNYFGKNNEGYEEMIHLFVTKERYFRKELSNKIYDNLLKELNSGNFDDFIESMLLDYYDKKYKDKGKAELLNINMNNIENAIKELKEFLNNIYK